MSRNINKWVLQTQTPEDEKYMLPLFSHIFKLFEEIFGSRIMI